MPTGRRRRSSPPMCWSPPCWCGTRPGAGSPSASRSASSRRSCCSIGDANARRMSMPWLAKPDVYARTMGWRSLGEEVDKLARATGARTIAAEQRDVVASLLYYQRDTGRTVLSWPASAVAEPSFRSDPAADRRRARARCSSSRRADRPSGSPGTIAASSRSAAWRRAPARRRRAAISPSSSRALRATSARSPDADAPMNRTGLLIALAIAAVVGIVFAL